ncbi:hypothetical protein TNCV_5019721 [Trichonephila clavipes]|nr:hypothetical protein TNCV_5019721 [Trichonephila clavipes]
MCLETSSASWGFFPDYCTPHGPIFWALWSGMPYPLIAGPLCESGVITNISCPNRMSGVSEPKENKGDKFLEDREPQEMF